MTRAPTEPGRLRGLFARFRRSELGGLTGDSGYVAAMQGAIAGAELVQVALITHTLGLAEFGRYALMVAFVMIISALLNLRIGIAATTFGARHMRGDPRAAAGVFQLSYLADVLTALLTAVVAGLVYLLVGSGIVDGLGLGLVLLFTLVPLSRTIENTPIVILRLRDRFRLVAGVTIATEMLRVALVLVALAVDESLLAVVVGLVVGKLTGAVLKAVIAYRVFARAFAGVTLARPALAHLPLQERRDMRRTMFKSSFITLDGVAQVQVPTLLLGAYVGAAEVGLYKVGMTIAAVIGKAADPASAAILPRLARLWTEERFADLRRLIRQATLVSLPLIALLYLAVVVLRDPILELIGGGPAARAAGTILILGAAGQAVYALVFWRGTVLHAAHRTGAVAAVSVIGAVFQVGALLVLIPGLGAEGAALAFLVSRLLINGSLSLLALRVLGRAGRGVKPPVAVEA